MPSRFTDERFTLWALFVVSLAPRVIFVAFAHPAGDYLDSDMGVYDMRALHLLSGELGPWDTFTPGGYPAFLALLYWPFGHVPTAVGFVQAMLSALTVVLTHELAILTTGNRRVALIAALAIAAHLPMILYSGLLLSETWFAFLLVLSAVLFVRATATDSPTPAMLGGLALGVAATVRPNLLLVVPFLPVLFYFGLSRNVSLTLRYSVLAYALLLVPVAAHSAHNSRLVDRWVPTSTNGGLNFYLNFADARSLKYVEGDYTHQITPVPNYIRYENDELVDQPFYDDRHFYEKGVRLIAKEPTRLLRGFWSLREALGLGVQDYWPGWRRWRFWLPFDSRAFAILFVLPGLAWLLLVFLSGAPFRKEGAGWLWLGVLLAGNLLAAGAFLGDPRIRVPYDPLYAIAASALYVKLGRHFQAKRPSQPAMRAPDSTHGERFCLLPRPC